MDKAVQGMEENTKEDYVEGCFKENFMKPHICPIATGNWCKDYMKCKNMERKE